jgi:RimJ/RimL family protein N-acetyltransferase
MNIEGKKVRLRAIEVEDLEKLHGWANDPEIWHMVVGWHFPYSMESQRKWFSSLDTDSNNKRFAIETLDRRLIGTAHLTDIDWKNNHASHGMVLGQKQDRGKGYGVDTIMTIMRYVFEELHFERLDSSMIEYNIPSVNVYCQNCGWHQEGRMRNWFFRKGRYWDKIIVGVTRDDYVALVSKLKYWE